MKYCMKYPMKYLLKYLLKYFSNKIYQKTALLLLLMVWAIPQLCFGGGMPFMRNFTADEYHAHTRNFDIITDQNGIVYVANFEGLLYYDHAEWHVLHTPGINRLTAVFCDNKNRVWVGGYNYFGYLKTDNRGCLQLHSLVDGKNQGFSAEVNWIWQRGHEVQVLLSNGKIYGVTSDVVASSSGNNRASTQKRLVPRPNAKLPKSGSSTYSVETNINQVQMLDNHLKAIATNGKGVIITDDQDRFLFDMTEENGLCNNNVNHVTYDHRGHLWGATDHGIFCVSLPSVYSHFTSLEGLKGDVLSVTQYQGAMLVGTINGLFIRRGMRFEQIPTVTHVCWQLASNHHELLAATSDGVFRVTASGKATRVNRYNTLSVQQADGGFYSGEIDGVFFNAPGGMRRRVSMLEKVTQLYRTTDGTVWLKNIYGQVWKKSPADPSFKHVVVNGNKNELATLIMGRKGVQTIPASGGVVPYPQFSYYDSEHVLWLTDNAAKHLYALKNMKRYTQFDALIKPLSDLVIRAMYRDRNLLWVGGDFGLVSINAAIHDPALMASPVVHIRNVEVNGDSIVWGGFGSQPAELPVLDSKMRNVSFTFSLDQNLLLGKPYFRYRLNHGNWSAWDTEVHADFLQLTYGSYTFEVQGRDAAGRLSEIVPMSFFVRYPIYLRWYAVLLYLAVLSWIVVQIVRWRMHRLVKEKIRLEKLLRETQGELIQQEKLAGIGKLTQGLIDRILNPMNYICNFAKLSIGLAKDLDANIEDEQEKLSEENYEDCKDILGMLSQNLKKVNEHGQNTTHTLKMMEEILEDRSGNWVKMDILQLLRDEYGKLVKEHQQIINQLHVHTEFHCPDGELMLTANPEMMSKVLNSMLSNAIYALNKKVTKSSSLAGATSTSTSASATSAFTSSSSSSSSSSSESANSGPFVPIFRLNIEEKDKQLFIRIYDNGTGISDNILDKIFDPFFTTKTTAEAAGVGLYISRDIIQGIGGDITVESVKGDYTEFTITIPIRNA